MATQISKPPELREDPPLLLTKSELAAHLRVSARTVDAMAARGELPAFRLVGSQRRWLRAEIVEWLLAK